MASLLADAKCFEVSFASFSSTVLIIPISLEAFTDLFYKPAILSLATAGYRSVP